MGQFFFILKKLTNFYLKNQNFDKNLTFFNKFYNFERTNNQNFDKFQKKRMKISDEKGKSTHY